MDEKTLLKLLHLQFEHERKLGEFAGKLNLSYLEIDLLDVVLDAVGVPADNTLAQIGKYGYGGWIEQPDTFSRAWYYDEFKRQVKRGNEAEYKTYLEQIIVTTTFQYLLDVQNMETRLISV
jgi:hypothetical protein